LFFVCFSERPSRRVACFSYTRLQPEQLVSENVAATVTVVSALSSSGSSSISSSHGLLRASGTINANPGGTPRFDSRLNTRVTRFHATTTSRFLEPFLRSVCGHGDLGRVARRVRRRVWCGGADVGGDGSVVARGVLFRLRKQGLLRSLQRCAMGLFIGCVGTRPLGKSGWRSEMTDCYGMDG